MQVNNPKNNTSNLIKQTEFAKKKAIRRLIGSVFMLLTALIILLNVTTKVKPIPVTPKAIEISSNSSAPLKPSSAPARQIAAVSSSPITASNPVSVAATATANASQPQDQGFKAGVLSQNAESNQTQQAAETVQPSPLIIVMNIGKKPSPADILNGNTSNNEKTIYYVQVAASPNKPGLQDLQKTLAGNNIKAFIQTGKNNIFRLRSGPFNNKDDANSNLAQIKTSLKQ